jgi:HEAT repeat protein
MRLRSLLAAALILLLATATARAGRLGGAYRGPFLESDGAGTPHGKRAMIDWRKFWMFRFEHQKETILADRIVALRKRAKRPTAKNIEKTVLPVLHEAMTHPSSWVRDAATLALGKIGAKTSLPYLVARMRDPDAQVAEDALLALGLFRDAAVIPHLTKVLAGKARRRAAFAALALGLTGDPAAKKPLLLAWRTALDRTPVDEPLTACIAVALGAVAGEGDVGEIATPLSRPRLDTLKTHVFQALGRIGGRDAKRALLKATAKARFPVRPGLALSLGRFPEKAVVARLLGKDGVLNGDSATGSAALVSLARIAANRRPLDSLRKKSVTALSKRAECPQKNLYLAMHATLAQGEFGLKESVPYCLEHLSSELREKYRDANHSAMAMSLGLLREAKAGPLLTAILAWPRIDQDYRGYCAFALGLLGDRANMLAVRHAVVTEPNRPDILRSGCWALALIGGKNELPVLFTVLKRNEEKTHHARGAAAIAIGLLGDDETLADLVGIAGTDDDHTTRAFAIAAIGWLCDRDEVPRLPRLFAGLYDRTIADPIRAAWTNL